MTAVKQANAVHGAGRRDAHARVRCGREGDAMPQVVLSAGGDAGIVPLDDDGAGVAEDLLDEGEIVILLLRPSRLFIVLGSLGSLVLVIAVAMALAYAARFPWAGWTDVQAFSLGFGLATLRLGWQALDWSSRLYLLTDRRVVRRAGVLRPSVAQILLRDVQHVAVLTLMRERLLGLGTIGFASSGSQTFTLYWMMVRDPSGVHRTVVDAVRRYGRRPGAG